MNEFQGVDQVELATADKLTLEHWAAKYWRLEQLLRDAQNDRLADSARATAAQYWTAAQAKTN